MKKIILSFFIFSLPFSLFAQIKDTTILYAGKDTTVSLCPPGCSNLKAAVVPNKGTGTYKIDSIPYVPMPFDSGTKTVLGDDAVSSVLPIGFTFCFFNDPYTQFYIGSNGWISFSPGQTRKMPVGFPIGQPVAIPQSDSTKAPLNSIMLNWSDLGLFSGVATYYKVYGTAPNRKLVISYYKARPACDNAKEWVWFYGEIILYETTNVIELLTDTVTYCKASDPLNYPIPMSVQGIQNKTGTQAFVTSGRNATRWQAFKDARRYTPDGSASYTLNWYKTDTTTANKLFTDIDTSKTHQVCPTTTTTYIAQLIRNGCPVDSFYDTVVVQVTGGAFPAVASVVSQPTCGQANGSVKVTVTGGTPNYDYVWKDTLGNVVGTTTGSASTTNTLTNLKAGKYYITASESKGCTAKDSVILTSSNAPTSAFKTTTPVCVNANSTITYTGNAGATATYAWNFSGGTIASGSGKGPYQVNWATSGAKHVTLTVTENGCPSTQTDSVVTVNAIPTSPFTTTTVCTNANSTITYTGSASSGATYTWSFNGGTVASGTGQGPYSVNWATSGTKNVTLTVSENGCTSTLTTVSVTVNAIPTSAFNTTTPVCINANSTITYTGSASSAATYTWNFNGGTATPGTGQGPHQVNWATSGAKHVTLTVTENNCTSPITDSVISVNSIPTSTFTVNSPVCIKSNSTVTYTGSANGTASYSWNFNGGTIVSGTGQGPYQVNWTTSGTKNATLTVTDNGCASPLTTVPIVVNPKPDTTFTVISPVCVNQNSTIKYTGADSATATFLWDFSGGNTVSGSGKGPYTVYWTTNGIKNIALKITNNGCIDSAVKTVNVNPNLNIPITGITTICIGDSTTLTASGATSYVWNTGNPQDTNPALSVKPLLTTQYIVNGQNSFCKGKDSITVTVNTPPTPSVGPDLEICFGESIPLNLSGNASYIYSWTPTTTLDNSSYMSPTANPKTTTTYIAKVTDNNSCVGYDTVQVTVHPLPTVDAGPDVTISSEETTVLKAITLSQGGFVWTPKTGLTTPESQSTVANPQLTTRYRVTLTDTNNCKTSDSVVVYKTCGDLYIPNAFSPNGDSLNDVFNVYQIGYTKINMYIFDKWGEKIYTMDSFNKPWDGKVNEEAAQQDVYVYIADAWDCFGQKHKYIGTVTLIK